MKNQHNTLVVRKRSICLRVSTLTKKSTKSTDTTSMATTADWTIVN